MLISVICFKCLKPISFRKVKRELLVLSHASHLPNLVRLLAVVVPSKLGDPKKEEEHQQMPSFVLEHAGPHSQWLCHGIPDLPGNNHPYLTEYEIKYYLLHLLVALDSLHSISIMHRDIKPRNVMINRQFTQYSGPLSEVYHLDSLPQTLYYNGALMLIDLGLADFYIPNTRYNVRVASRHYKSPELLVGYEYYDYAIDMWGVGCILAGLLLRREPVFRG